MLNLQLLINYVHREVKLRMVISIANCEYRVMHVMTAMFSYRYYSVLLGEYSQGWGAKL